MAEGISEYSPLEHLKMLRHDFSDEIPDRILHSTNKDNKYKVRRNWFQGVVADTENALSKGKIKTSEGKLAAEQLLERFTSEEFKQRELTEKRDIEEANKLIDIILQEKL
jgi:hypothetical protein